MLAGPLGLQGTLLLRGILHNGLDFVVALLSTLLEATACGGTELPGLLGDTAHLPGPLGALGVGGVSRGLVLTLLLNLSGALNDIVLNIVDHLLGPALGFVLSPADLGSLDVTVLDKRSPADLSSLVEGDLLVLDETVLPEVLLALLDHLNLVNTPLAISSRSGSSNSREAHIG